MLESAKRLLRFLWHLTLVFAAFCWREGKAWVRRSPREACVAALVLTVHVFGIIYSVRISELSLPKRVERQVLVQTVSLQKPPPPKPRVAKLKPKPKPKPVAKAKPKPKPKPVAKAKPKPAAKPKPVVDKAKERRRQELLKLVDESIEKVEKSPEIVEEELPQPQAAPPPKSPAPAVATAVPLYESELVKRLQLMLRLPDYGDVRVELTLARDGSVRKLQVLGAESEKNRAYVLDALPRLRFAPLGKAFSSEEEHTFLLTLTNEV